MGTRGITGVVVDGVKKFGYQQNDSYPDGVGLAVLRDLRTFCEAGTDDGLRLRQLAQDLRVVDDHTQITQEAIDALAPYTDTGVGHTMNPDGSVDSSLNWYQLTRGLHGELKQMLEAGYVEDSSEFPEDSLFCEWGYVVDLDGGSLDVYEGFQKSPPTKGLWKGVKPSDGYGGSPNEYYPCELRASWSLASLPTDEEFLAALSDGEDD